MVGARVPPRFMFVTDAYSEACTSHPRNILPGVLVDHAFEIVGIVAVTPGAMACTRCDRVYRV